MIVAQEGHHKCLSILLAHGVDVDQCREVSAVVIWSICHLDLASTDML